MARASARRKILVADLATYSPEDLVGHADLCNEFIAFLETTRFDQQQVADWSHGHECRLSVAEQGTCRVVQRLLEVLGGSARDQLVARLLPHTLGLLESPHGNHVLTKVIEVVPRPTLGAIISCLERQGARALARHRFGCRVVERLVEHATDEQMHCLLEGWITHAEELSRHMYGNFVVQSVLEHGSSARKNEIIQQLMPFLPHFASHRTASHVVQKALVHANVGGQEAISIALLNAPSPNSFVQVAASRYGSFVCEELHNIFGTQGPGMEAKAQLERFLEAQEGSPCLVRVAVKFGILEEETLDDHASVQTGG